MDASSIAILRLANQQLIKTDLKTPREIVSWMGAMQAQDFNMAKWAIGLRLRGITDKQVEEAMNNGDFVRTHILRPTWHFVSRDDIHWMLQLSAPRIRAATRATDKKLELTEDTVNKTNSIIRRALEKEPHQTRQELGEKLRNGGIILDNYRLNHIMYHAELNGVVCNGIVRGKKQTYDLLESRVPKKDLLSKDESLHKLAYKYFRSHGPATLQDFIWWSGLTTAEARLGVELVKNEFVVETVESQDYIYHGASHNTKLEADIMHLTPAFDELLVSYKDRKEVLIPEYHKKVITSNGIFQPAIFKNGKIIGVWKKSQTKDKMLIEPTYFSSLDKTTQEKMDRASLDYYNFMK